jgi:hypothetical protein
MLHKAWYNVPVLVALSEIPYIEIVHHAISEVLDLSLHL